MVLRFLQDKVKVDNASQVLLTIPGCRGHSQRFPKTVSGVHLSSYFGLKQTIKYQFKNGASPDLKDTLGRTLLSWVAENGHDAVMMLLMAWDDVEVNLRDTSGKMPLLWAAENGHSVVVTLLMAQDDVEVNLKDTLGRTPLSWVAENGHEVVVVLLVGWGDAEVNLKDMSGRTLMLWAAENRHEVVVTLLASTD
jgi:ankyrin repeat protein